MLYAIQDKTGKIQLIVQYAGDHTGKVSERLLTIKMAVSEQLRHHGGVDYSNLADDLHRNEFTIYGFRAIQVN